MDEQDRLEKRVKGMEKRRDANLAKKGSASATLASTDQSVLRSDVSQDSGDSTKKTHRGAREAFEDAANTSEQRKLLHEHLRSTRNWWTNQLQNAKDQAPSDVYGFIDDVNWWLKAAGYRLEIMIPNEEDEEDEPVSVLCTLKPTKDRYGRAHLQINGRHGGGSITRGFKDTDFILVPVVEGNRGSISKAKTELRIG